MLINVLLFLFLLLALILLFVITSAFIGFLITRVPFVPTAFGDIKFIVEKVGITSVDTFYDLGSGNGKVCFFVNKMTGAKCIGFEQTLWTHWWAKLKNWLIHFPSPIHGEGLRERLKIRFVNKDFFSQNWSEANIVYCYLYPPLMGRIADKFRAEMKPGSIAVVRDFPFPNMLHSEKYYLPKEHEVYIYRL